MKLVQVADEVPDFGFGLLGASFWRTQVLDRRFGVECGALKSCRKKAGSPVCGTGWRQPAPIRNGDERGQVLIGRTQRISNPGSDAWESFQHKPRVHLAHSGAVSIAPGGQRMAEGDVIHAFR